MKHNAIPPGLIATDPSINFFKTNRPDRNIWRQARPPKVSTGAEVGSFGAQLRSSSLSRGRRSSFLLAIQAGGHRVGRFCTGDWRDPACPRWIRFAHASNVAVLAHSFTFAAQRRVTKLQKGLSLSDEIKFFNEHAYNLQVER